MPVWTLLLLMLVAAVIPSAVVGWLSVADTRELLVRDAQELAQERVKQLPLKTPRETTRASVWPGCTGTSGCRWRSSKRASEVDADAARK